MSAVFRKKNGRFIRKKANERNNKALVAMANAKKNRKNSTVTTSETIVNSGDDICEGFHIVNFQELRKTLVCPGCKEPFRLYNVNEETVEGISSILRIECVKCGSKSIAHTGKKIKLNGHTYSQITMSLVLSSVYADIENTGLQKVIACVDAPGISMESRKGCKRDGQGIKKEPNNKESNERFAEKERRLTKM